MSVGLAATRVIANSQVRSGQPIIRGIQITVWDILGWTAAPELKPEDIQAALQFACQLV